jgi:hypothetical protein
LWAIRSSRESSTSLWHTKGRSFMTCKCRTVCFCLYWIKCVTWI